MPYIPRDDRADARRRPENVGELTYAVSELIEDYRQRKGDRYQVFAEIRAALLGASDEFRRTVVDPYEAMKLIQNGPVHEPPDKRREREARKLENQRTEYSAR